MRIKGMTYFLAALLFLAPHVLYAKAGVLLFPTRIVEPDSIRNIEITLKNSGDATGKYRIDLEDMEMLESGEIKQLPPKNDYAFSGKQLLRVSPREMTLKPNETQSIRLLVKRNPKLPDGEYRSHLKVLLVDGEVDEKSEHKDSMDTEKKGSGFNISLNVRQGVSIPVIIRKGKTEYAVKILDVKLKQENGKPVLDMLFERQGNRSVFGDIKVTDSSGKVLKYFAGIAIYHPTPKKKIILPLDVAEGTKLSGKLHITYTEQDKDGGAQMAEKDLEL